MNESKNSNNKIPEKLLPYVSYETDETENKLYKIYDNFDDFINNEIGGLIIIY